MEAGGPRVRRISRTPRRTGGSEGNTTPRSVSRETTGRRTPVARARPRQSGGAVSVAALRDVTNALLAEQRAGSLKGLSRSAARPVLVNEAPPNRGAAPRGPGGRATVAARRGVPSPEAGARPPRRAPPSSPEKHHSSEPHRRSTSASPAPVGLPAAASRSPARGDAASSPAPRRRCSASTDSAQVRRQSPAQRQRTQSPAQRQRSSLSRQHTDPGLSPQQRPADDTLLRREAGELRALERDLRWEREDHRLREGALRAELNGALAALAELRRCSPPGDRPGARGLHMGTQTEDAGLREPGPARPGEAAAAEALARDNERLARDQRRLVRGVEELRRALEGRNDVDQRGASASPTGDPDECLRKLKEELAATRARAEAEASELRHKLATVDGQLAGAEQKLRAAVAEAAEAAKARQEAEVEAARLRAAALESESRALQMRGEAQRQGEAMHQALERARTAEGKEQRLRNAVAMLKEEKLSQLQAAVERLAAQRARGNAGDCDLRGYDVSIDDEDADLSTPSAAAAQ
eukprot:TRINITY_DN11008_c0_g1_i1.p1 TRINITY_DN11008_c0_g1~~TRINITY_DN11008_c0_g1_i1.p1  ORF type:complete len:553 (+),score=115.99 TRINITY_DN11008_c0_g1_i1:84-1661(+)